MGERTLNKVIQFVAYILGLAASNSLSVVEHWLQEIYTCVKSHQTFSKKSCVKFVAKSQSEFVRETHSSIQHCTNYIHCSSSPQNSHDCCCRVVVQCRKITKPSLIFVSSVSLVFTIFSIFNEKTFFLPAKKLLPRSLRCSCRFKM